MLKTINIKIYNILKKFNNPRHARGFFRFNSHILFLSLFMVSSLLFWSCSEEFDEMGLDLIDGNIQLGDTVIPLMAHTQAEDSVPTYLANRHLLGFYSDDVFGKTQAGIYTEVLPMSMPVFFSDIHPDSLVIDSVVLSLAYDGYFGDKSVDHSIQVHEVSEVFPTDTVYSSRSLSHQQQLQVMNPEFVPYPEDSLYVGPDSIHMPPHLRIRISNSLGERFFEDQDVLSNISTNDDFRDYFKGFYIVAEEMESTGAMLYFNLGSSYSRLQVFYSKMGDENYNTLEFAISDPLVRNYTYFNNFGYNNVAPEISQQLEGDTLLGDSLIFVQSMANFRAKITLPDLDDLLDDQGDLAINSARLILPVDNDMIQDPFGIASSMILLRENPNNPEGEFLSLTDQFIGQEYFGGRLNEDKGEYMFNITDHVQRLINQQLENKPLYLRVSGSVENAGRAVLKGPGRQEEENRMRLIIRYSKPETN